jgi:hypothetical protein
LVRHRQIVLAFTLIAVVSIAAIVVAPHRNAVPQHVPEGLSDSQFWNLITSFSEPDGYFRSDNFVSNEIAFQRVIPRLKKEIRPGGIYLGVGPDQNFTYIAATEPKLAFIVDIRRQNLLLHLMYKALFELSNNRMEFVSKLFARPIAPNSPRTGTVEELFESLSKTSVDTDFSKETFDAILRHLRERHHFELAPDDCNTIELVHRAFVSAGPDIRYSYPNQNTWRRFPTYSELMLETDGTTDAGGTNHSYMASEELFQTIKNLQSQNRIVPIVGDFAGEKAIRSVGRYVRGHDATISTFYASNVEFYLFQTEDWRRFFSNVSMLPVSDESVFIRSYFKSNSTQFPDAPSWLDSSTQSYVLIDNIPAAVSAFADGHIHSYFDVIRRSSP